MGEAKRKRRSHAAILEAYPYCIYCGDPATTAEHMPPIIMFWGRQRPNEFVFPCCEPCNYNTRHSDQVASLMGRVFPDPPDQAGRAELRRLMQAGGNNVRGLLEEMVVRRGGQKLARRNIPDMPD